MKTSTAEAKLNALLGLTEKAEVVKTKTTGRIVGVTEEEIQEFRQAQGLIYFLQAPALFTAKVCPHCGEKFLVSRKYVAYCSYTCIRESLRDIGIEWRKGKDLEATVNDPQVFNGNEPIWIRYNSMTQLKEALSILLTHLENEDSPLSLSPQKNLELGGSLSLDTTTGPETKPSRRSSSARTTTSSTTLPSDLFPGLKQPRVTKSQSSQKKKNVKRKFT